MRDILRAGEKLAYTLRALYERNGYKKYDMSRFEEYALYLEHSAFIKSERIITFTDLDGRLLALKPDVTLSIVKNARNTGGVSKLYYQENVYRAARDLSSYREIEQIGLEVLGAADEYTRAEVVRLAYETLAATGAEFVLELSHLGFLGGLIESLDISGEDTSALLREIRRKNASGVIGICRSAGLDGETGELFAAITSLYGSAEEVFSRAQKLARNDAMNRAVEELSALCEVLGKMGCGGRINIDFSIASDMDYYNGVIFRGYVEGAPVRVLSGGQYDKLTQKFGGRSGAMGFALYIDELSMLRGDGAEADADIFLQYRAGDDPALIFRAKEELASGGQSVYAGTELPGGYRAERTVTLADWRTKNA